MANKAVSTIESGINEFANDIANSFGNGNTEISISNIESGNPAYSIKTIQPLTSPNKDAKELIFTQGSLTSGENEGDRRTTINLGLGKRILVEDDKAIVGANVFVDYETSSKHKRASLGLEYKRSNFSAGANNYWALSSQLVVHNNAEEVLDGYDIKLDGQMPYAPWATIKGTHYYWDAKTGDNINGNILGVEIELSPSTSFEIGSENSNTMNRTAYAELTVKLPFDGNEKLDNFQLDDTPFRAQADMSGELLAMVERHNKIQIEKQLSTDVNGNMIAGGTIYSTITIGTQTWTANNVSIVPTANNVLGTDYWSEYNDGNTANDTDAENAHEDGYYYTWDAAMNVCPSGWKLPSDSDWKVLEGQLGMSVADQDATGWRGTDEGTKLKVGGSSGFEAKLAGYRNTGVSFNGRGVYTTLWSSTESGSSALRRNLHASLATVYRNTHVKANGFSVRCLKD